MQVLKRTVRVAALLIVVGNAGAVSAQRLSCTQLPASERERARAAGQCRDPAPIIDVAPKQGSSDPAADAPITPQVRPGMGGSNAPGSSAAGPLSVPNVVGLSFDDARSRLTRFTLQRSYRAAAEPGGTVLAQAPMAPASVPAGAAVSLVLSDGSLVRVPRVSQININEARQRLQKDLDLKAQPVVVTSDQRVGTVIEQQPAEGTLVKRGSVVRLHVSAGQEGPELIDVPNVVGLSFDRARARLARFSVERSERPRSEKLSVPEGQVVEQTPRAAARVAAGSVIVLTVSSAADTRSRAPVEIFEMPNVVGRNVTEAVRVLAEFKVSRAGVDNATPRDQVLAQTPAPGVTLMPGDAVTLQVSVGPSAAALPVKAAAANGAAGVPAPPKPASGLGVLTGVLAISAAVVLGLIAGALLMRQLLLRRRADTAADNAITALSSIDPALGPPLQQHGITSVDILLEEEAAAEVALENDVALGPPTEPQEKIAGSTNDEQKSPGS